SYGARDMLESLAGPTAALEQGQSTELTWQIPDLGGAPIAEIGLSLTANGDASGSVYLDYLTWDGTPDVTFRRPTFESTSWRRAWVDATDQTDPHWPEAYRVVQNEGTGLLIQGTREWTDYEVSAPIIPHLFTAGGI